MKPPALDAIDTGRLPSYSFVGRPSRPHDRLRYRHTHIPLTTTSKEAPAQPPDSGTAKSATLDSWKDIATYLGRGVRTVQRWESDLGLPVHRIGQGNRSPVFAFTADLDFWLHARRASIPCTSRVVAPPAKIAPRSGMRTSAAVHRSHELIARLHDLTWKHQQQAERLAAVALRFSALRTLLGSTKADLQSLSNIPNLMEHTATVA